MGQVDSPETPEIYENTRKFYKSDQTLYQTKRDINKLVWEKSHFKKQWDSGFSNVFYGKNQNLEMPEINRKLPK